MARSNKDLKVFAFIQSSKDIQIAMNQNQRVYLEISNVLLDRIIECKDKITMNPEDKDLDKEFIYLKNCLDKLDEHYSSIQDVIHGVKNYFQNLIMGS